MLEDEGLGVEFTSKLPRLIALIAAIAFVNDTDLVAKGEDIKRIMNEILEMCNALHKATGRQIE